jgi:hypothetical protein
VLPGTPFYLHKLHSLAWFCFDLMFEWAIVGRVYISKIYDSISFETCQHFCLAHILQCYLIWKVPEELALG